MAGVQLGGRVTRTLMKRTIIGPASLTLTSPDRTDSLKTLNWFTRREVSELTAHFMRIQLLEELR